jgi:hypothetical protein
VPVGDAPREADFVLLRSETPGPPPFRGLWRNLTTWNVLEYKGPIVAPRLPIDVLPGRRGIVQPFGDDGVSAPGPAPCHLLAQMILPAANTAA